MNALARLAALQRIREERVQELIAACESDPACDSNAVGDCIEGVRDADREVSLLARAIQPCDTENDADAVLSVALVGATLNLVSAAETVVAEGKLPAILHQLLKTHARSVRDMLESRRRRQLVAAAERVDAGAEVVRPRVVCLCGSIRFPDAWKAAHREESLAGRIVLSVGVMIHAGDEPIRTDGLEKRALDELHLRKIDLADEVLVLNVGGYVGDSTRREVAYAVAHGKAVRWLETP